MFIKNTTIKLASTFLTLSLMCTCLHAAEFTEEHRDTAAVKIQRHYRGEKVRKLFQEIDTEAEIIAQNMQQNPNLAKVAFTTHIKSLGENSTINDILTAEVWCQIARDLAPENVEVFNTYLETLRICEDPIKRQIASLIKSLTIQNIDKKKEVLREIETSNYPVFKNAYYGILARALRDSKDIDQAQEYLMRLLELPKQYHVRAYKNLADLNTSDAERKFYLRRIIKIGRPEQAVAEAKSDLEQMAKKSLELADSYDNGSDSNFYNPQEALRIYRSLLEDPQTLNTDDINFRIASILTSGPADVQDKSKAIEIYKAIRNREGNKGSSYYWSAAYYLIDNYIGQNQYSEALGLVTEDLNDPEWQFSEELKTIYQNGSDEIREAIDSSEALRSKLP